MAKRKAMSKKLRFEILKRDWFKCRYCWKTPIDWVKLQVDHIIPVYEWWENEIENLCTACFDCNIWKGKTMLSKKQTNRDIKKEMEEMREQETILEEYYKYLRAKKKLNLKMQPYKWLEQVLSIEIPKEQRKTVNNSIKKYWLEITMEAYYTWLDSDKDSMWYLMWISRNMYLKENDEMYEEKRQYYDDHRKKYDKKWRNKKWIYENYETFRYMVDNYSCWEWKERVSVSDTSRFCETKRISTWKILNYLKEQHKIHIEDIKKSLYS